MISVIPAIDIINGKCVRLTKGDFDKTTFYDITPMDMAKTYADFGFSRLHLVDLQGAAESSPKNLRTLEEIASSCPCLNIEWGGGIASSQDLQDVLACGASFAIIGSLAVTSSDLFIEWLKKYKEKLILGADIRNGLVSIKGWKEDSRISIEGLIDTYLQYNLKNVICTDISKDGMLEGPNFDLYVDLEKKYPDVDFTVSGGISSMEDISKLDSMGLRSVIVGKAIYEGRINMKELSQYCFGAKDA